MRPTTTLRPWIAGLAAAAALMAAAPRARAQAANTDKDKPTYSMGATIFTDYSYQSTPKSTDSAGQSYSPNLFEVKRTYINFKGKLNHWVEFRITPDITKATGASLNGSYAFRLKYGFAQFDLDDWMTKGSWVRFGLQQTPYIDFDEGIYRYRFQGETFVDHEHLVPSSDKGVSFLGNLPKGYGTVHVGLYNGEGYGSFESNPEKALEFRVSVRPAPKSAAMKGLLLTAYGDVDHVVANATKNRFFANIFYEQPVFRAAFEYADAKTQASPTALKTHSKGYSFWAEPGKSRGVQGLIRFDHYQADTLVSTKENHLIVGVSYWFPISGKDASVLFDYEQQTYTGTPQPPDVKKVGVHLLINF